MKRKGMTARVHGWEVVEESLVERIDEKTRLVKFMEKKMEEVLTEESREEVTRISRTVIRRRRI